ncbi:MAG: hypothetical protein HY368_01220 [Candidatus Aenigmarchaeota archaeon]|nr:hypothetical protein [Candidatus Aenigmarchaeota archaeon]
MKIIIPMAGSSGSFIDEGLGLKPLAMIDGKTMIERVCGMFPKGSSFIFLCRKEDLEQGLEIELKKISPSAKIVAVAKPTRGVAETVMLADGHAGEDEEIIIHHADSFAVWDFGEFLAKAREADGALSVFSGFSPAAYTHSLYGLAKTESGFVKEIVEKQPFAVSADSGYTAAGSYYFRSWRIFRKYAERMMGKNINAGGIFYDSLVFNEMISDGLRVIPYIVEDFVSWGEPVNVKEYLFWSGYFASLVGYEDTRKTHDMTDLIPAAGKGKRFADAGYKTPKPLINVLGKEMILQSALSLPKARKYVFVILKEQSDSYGLDKLLKQGIHGCEVVVIDRMTDGMARTCLMAEKLLDKSKPVLISSCDYSFVYNDEKFEKLVEKEKPDAIIWTFREYPDARLAPKAYGYLVVENGAVKKISEKVPISEQPHRDHIVQGVFWFRTADLFLWAAKRMIEKGRAINGEYYVATAINEMLEEGMKVLPFEVDKYICWGTPLDMKTFEYWQEYFSRDAEHSYWK